MYCIDTSGFLDGWVRNYPPDVFPPIWENLDYLIKQRQIIATEEIFYELERKNDDIFKWVKERRDMFIPTTTDIQVEVASILSNHKRLIDSRKGRSGADPFVIAVAKLKNCTVVTGEKPTGKMNKPKIPDVCRSMGLQCINLLELFRELNWVF